MSVYSEKAYAERGAAVLGPLTTAQQEQPALHQVIQRLGNLAVRLGDINTRTSLFIERTVGKRPEPVEPMRDVPQPANRPAFLELSALIDTLEIRLFEAERLARENDRIG